MCKFVIVMEYALIPKINIVQETLDVVCPVTKSSNNELLHFNDCRPTNK